MPSVRSHLPATPHRRRSVRLQGYDYRCTGAYFITICTFNRSRLFGEISCGGVHLSDAGRQVWAAWNDIPVHHPTVELDLFVAMPDHVHGIILNTSGAFEETGPARFGRPLASSLSTVVRSFKASTTRAINAVRGVPCRVWQRGYHEHVIRNQASYDRLQRYITENPARWVNAVRP